MTLTTSNDLRFTQIRSLGMPLSLSSRRYLALDMMFLYDMTLQPFNNSHFKIWTPPQQQTCFPLPIAVEPLLYMNRQK